MTRELIEGFVARGKTFFVRQEFHRAKKGGEKHVRGWFLLSHYDNLTTAQDHFGAIAHDPYRYLYNWNDPSDRDKLIVAASSLKEYRVYANVFTPGWEKNVTRRMRDKLRYYINSLGWKPATYDSVQTHYEVQFGELFIKIKFGQREAKVKFDEIESIY